MENVVIKTPFRLNRSRSPHSPGQKENPVTFVRTSGQLAKVIIIDVDKKKRKNRNMK
jgi:hypothetical protein